MLGITHRRHFRAACRNNFGTSMCVRMVANTVVHMLIARVPTSPRASRVDDVPDATAKLRPRLTTHISSLPTFMTVQLTSSETTQNSHKRPLYEGTTQFKNWRYSVEQLREIRSSLNAAAVAVIKNALEVNSARLSFRHCPQCPR